MQYIYLDGYFTGSGKSYPLSYWVPELTSDDIQFNNGERYTLGIDIEFQVLWYMGRTVTSIIPIL